MFSPMAVAAKMITWVAIDMFASEPSWVNGKAKATTKADRISTRLCRWVHAGQQAHHARADQSTAMMAPMKPRNETNEPPSSMFERERRSEHGQPP